MSNNLKVLFVEDDAAVRLGGTQALRLSGLEVQSFERAEHALRYIEFGFPGILVSDLRLPGMSGLALLEHTVGTDASLPVILVTGHGDIPMAVDAMRRGAYDFVEKPYSSEQLVDVSQRALEKRRLTLELATVRQALAHRDNIEARILGRSPAIERLRRMILELADADANALILGETGTGKELVARSLHDYGHRKAKNFAAINCAGIPELLFESEVFGHEAGSFTGAIKRRIGKIEYARGGTLFLDEIETMQMSLQVKLLRLLQEKKFERVGSNDLLEMDCRIVAGSKADLLALSSTNHFRDDLYYRLGVMVLEIPPLRERREDIPLLFEHFVVRAAAEYNRPIPEISPAQRHDLMSRPWGGNVRELRNVAERFTLGMPTRVDPASSDDNTGKPSLETKLNLFERQLIEEALRGCSGRAAVACERLGVPKKTLYDKMRRLGISTEEFK
ncbi:MULTISPECIES: sigma-54-dependent transcriptional regulator [Paraburkholderia]|uniref:Two-component system, NtrC family, C4-dicarboxylate transport response regulator DctD n=2 Tax=Paraburkholderia aspalathi TaxID=1324617 RepID=A0A1I6XZP6_9BURK|nr:MULTISPECIES: sigma-54 dependent transcriptional regulator [Paraburkholderia]MBK3843765.1 sigma-54-dependent Fis family transcriptional regulator [Paraburkholderia aspalathi]MCX4142123.1 sigma-54 dependent transcriptional regulator [Paraburkholderia aspalathi]MDN7174803.1 sigma-54 dependent transcriptional regulator [Paraburkholderia sp. SEWSISQ10-3 4]MDQ6504444.1 sigma-54 dependent transcriptional regulator [Paraburkholderia aspalathi]CAE6724655.1 C4-dicarboxylate transport transcriptional